MRSADGGSLVHLELSHVSEEQHAAVGGAGRLLVHADDLRLLGGPGTLCTVSVVAPGAPQTDSPSPGGRGKRAAKRNKGASPLRDSSAAGDPAEPSHSALSRADLFAPLEVHASPRVAPGEAAVDAQGSTDLHLPAAGARLAVRAAAGAASALDAAAHASLLPEHRCTSVRLSATDAPPWLLDTLHDSGAAKGNSSRVVRLLLSRLLSGRPVMLRQVLRVHVMGHAVLLRVLEMVCEAADRAVGDADALWCCSDVRVDVEVVGPDTAGGCLTDGAALGAKIEAAGRDAGGEAGARAAGAAFDAGRRGASVKLSDLEGMSQVTDELRMTVVPALRAAAASAHRGGAGVLICGPPGSGKTVLARAVAGEAGVPLACVSGPDIVSDHVGEASQALRGVYAAAKAVAPAVVFLDEVDSMAPKNAAAGGARLVSSLLSELDSVRQGRHPVVTVCASNRSEDIHQSLRRPGRLDREIDVQPPNARERLSMLRTQLRGFRHQVPDAVVADVAESAHGFVPADVSALATEAAMTALSRWVRESGGAGGACDAPPPTITAEDFLAAKARVRPTAMRSVDVEVPKVSWSDIGGLGDVKQRLREMVDWPYTKKDALERIGASPPAGVLLYGPPGCSKTTLARAVAGEAGLNFISIKGPELLSKYVGESEKALSALFARARRAAPAIIFFDEIDGLTHGRATEAALDAAGGDAGAAGSRVVSQLLVELDGGLSRGDVVVLAATNRPDHVDPALLRPGRIDRLLYVGPPERDARLEILQAHMRKMPVADDVRLSDVAELSEGYTGADLAGVARQAAMHALAASDTHVRMCHVEQALHDVMPSLATT
ncbi:unnamed protein product [Pedinophyceae sp. YPF-701]|nr:unnamed protein product [Pedinophyceae sp. YPF-701]